MDIHKTSWLNNTKCSHASTKEALSDCLRKLSHSEILSAIPDTWFDTSPPSNWGIPGTKYLSVPTDTS